MVAFPPVAAIAAIPQTVPVDPTMSFRVDRGDTPIGTHKLRFHEEADGLHVTIDIQLAVTFGPITVFRYTHQNEEVWRDGRLVSIETHTDDDGKKYWVKGKATDKGFEVDSSFAGKLVAPAGIIPASYWNPDILKQTQILDTQKGRIFNIAIKPGATTTEEINGRPQLVREYVMSGDLRLTLYYTPDGEWVNIAFDARGAKVTYEVERLDSAVMKDIAENE
ncbi:MAG: hypothetical protein GC184_14940 [Rhizobiales bacterium]|nr:hypothetical protein [Hyphomicrobiales bacterium]